MRCLKSITFDMMAIAASALTAAAQPRPGAAVPPLQLAQATVSRR